MPSRRQETKYSQLTRLLGDEIKSGKLPYHQQLPTEEQLSERFGVSRITVRQALTLLEQNGYIRKIQGKGSFVTWQQTQMQLNILRGFSEEMRQMGLLPTTKLLDISVVGAEGEVAEQLQLPPDTPVYRLVRLRLANGIPMCVESLHVSQSLCPGLENQPLEKSIYTIFTEEYHHRLQYADQEMQAGRASTRDAGRLGIGVGAPVLLTRRTTFLEDGTPLEYVHSAYRGDRYKITARLELSAVAP